MENKWVRLLLACCFASVCLAVVAAPVLADRSHPVGAALLYLSFSPACHQLSERSFSYHGHPWAVCHRCAGIYLGLFLATLIPGTVLGFVHSPRRRQLWVGIASLPLLADAVPSLFGFWHNAPASRLATGILFGCMLGTLLRAALCELVPGALSISIRPRPSTIQGGTIP